MRGSARTALIAALSIATACLAGAATALAQSDERSDHVLFVENDLFSGTDRHYTNGLRFQRTRDDAAEAPWWARRAVDRLFELCSDEGASRDCFSQRRGFAITHLMYTPEDLTRKNLIVADRPYGGWFHYGSIFDLYNERELHHLELSVGVVGKASLAGPVHRGWHEIINSTPPEGWDHQLDTEPGLLFLYRWSKASRILEGWNRDETLRWFSLTPHAVATVGNVFTYGGAGLTARLGYNIKDPLLPPIQAVGADVENRGNLEAYVFISVEGRALARNLFLDGNTFTSSHSVDKKTFVRDVETGAYLRWKRYAVTYRTVSRSREFDLQDRSQSWGSVTLTLLSSF